MNENIYFSIVIPVYNEEKNINRYPKELIPVLDQIRKSYEVIVVEDGSQKDKSWEALKKIAVKYKQFRLLRHSRNYGMGAAYQTAFNHCRGKYVLTYSADLEVSPKYISEVLEKLKDGYDMVNTNRQGRWKESGGILRRLPSIIANRMIEMISGIKIKDTGSGLKGFRNFIVKNLKIYGDMHRFLPAYSSLYTEKITEIDVDYLDRTYGQSAYGSLSRVYTVFLDLVSMKFLLSFATKPFSMMPGRLFGSLGMGAFLVGFFLTVYMISSKLIYGISIGNRPLFIIGLILIIVGVQLVMTGLLGELMMRSYFEGSNKEPYIVIEEI